VGFCGLDDELFSPIKGMEVFDQMNKSSAQEDCIMELVE
jgi:hypothetical protein